MNALSFAISHNRWTTTITTSTLFLPPPPEALRFLRLHHRATHKILLLPIYPHHQKRLVFSAPTSRLTTPARRSKQSKRNEALGTLHLLALYLDQKRSFSQSPPHNWPQRSKLRPQAIPSRDDSTCGSASTSSLPCPRLRPCHVAPQERTAAVSANILLSYQYTKLSLSLLKAGYDPV